MMMAIRGHYDGKVIIPNEPVDLPRGTELVFHFDPSATANGPSGVPSTSMFRFSGMIAMDDLDLMKRAIADGCPQVHSDEW
jgi:hypothetical protein